MIKSAIKITTLLASSLLADAPPASSPAKTAPISEVKTPIAVVKKIADDSDYEIRGFFGADEFLEVSVARKGQRSSDWIPVGKRRGDIFIREADSKQGTAVLVRGKVTTLLRLSHETPNEEKEEERGPITAEQVEAIIDAKSKEWREKYDKLHEAMAGEGAFRKQWMDLEDSHPEFVDDNKNTSTDSPDPERRRYARLIKIRADAKRLFPSDGGWMPGMTENELEDATRHQNSQNAWVQEQLKLIQ